MDRPVDVLLQRLYRQNEFAIKLGLDNMARALELCRHPHRDQSHALVGGTNGKGQVAATIAGIMTRAGQRCGLFTSPHLVSFAERIRFDGDAVSDDVLCAVGSQVLASFAGEPSFEAQPLALADDGPRPVLTFFELATVMATLAFQQAGARTAVYEVGLGGRLDATNALEPCLSVVTNVSLEHTRWLGDTLEAIAFEKGAIARQGRTVVVADRAHGDLIEREVLSRGARPLRLGRDFDLRAAETFVGLGREIQVPACAGMPAFQRVNVATAIAGALAWADEQRLVLSDDTVREGVAATRWPGRFMRLPSDRLGLRGDRPLWLDAAHNPGAAEALADAWLEMFPGRPLVVVLGMLEDKDVATVVATLQRRLRPLDLIVTPIGSHRALSPAELCRRAALPAGAAAPSLLEAIDRARTSCPTDGQVLVTGSIYLLGETLETLQCRDLALSTRVAPRRADSVAESQGHQRREQ